MLHIKITTILSKSAVLQLPLLVDPSNIRVSSMHHDFIVFQVPNSLARFIGL
jgi:hypothetical protein